MNADSEPTSRRFSVRSIQSIASRQNSLVVRGLQEISQLPMRRAEELVERGDKFIEDHYYDHAIADYSEAIRLNPGCAEAFYNRGYAYQKKGDNNQAIEDYTEAIRLDPKFVWAYSNRGDAHQVKGDYNQAIEDYSEAIRLNPGIFDS